MGLGRPGLPGGAGSRGRGARGWPHPTPPGEHRRGLRIPLRAPKSPKAETQGRLRQSSTYTSFSDLEKMLQERRKKEKEKRNCKYDFDGGEDEA